MSTFQWIAFAAIIVVSGARITRLLIFDTFPPIKKVRDWFIEWTDESNRKRGWQTIAYCPYCMSFWVMLLLGVWADLAGVLDGAPAFGWSGGLSVPLWWLINGCFAASYLAAMVMIFDGDSGDGDSDDAGDE